MRRRLLLTLVGVLLVAFGGLAVNLLTSNEPVLGLDLQGGISVTQQPVGDYDPAALDLAVERIRDRVDSLGVSEPEILRQGDAIVVNLPGVDNQQDAIELVQVTGQVYLRPVQQCIGEGVEEPEEDPAATTTDPSATGTTVAADTSAPPVSAATSAPGPSRRVGGTTPPTDPAATDASATTGPAATEPPTTDVVADPDAPDPSSTTPAPETSAAPIDTAVPVDPLTTAVASDPAQQQVLPLRGGGQCLVGAAGGSGAVFQNDARADIFQGGWGVTVGLRGGSEGTDVWNALASECFSGGSTCPSRRLAIELDGEIISAPSVNEPRFSGDVQITGDFSEGEARDLARVLKSGSLPVRMETQSVQRVSATLGKDSLRAAIVAGIVGVALVLLFMLLYYRALGLIVVAGVCVSSALLYTVIALLSATRGLALSLAGIAGVIISVGVTVDSYVVFFERLKDEVRSGRTMRNSAQRGFAGAWRTILMADVVSLIGAGVLWYLTVGAVRNFAFFLGLSTLVDLVIAYCFTRPAVVLLARTDWMARRKVMGIEAVRVADATTGGRA